MNSRDKDVQSLGPRDRRRMLLEFLLPVGSAHINELASHFGVSRMTVHRDLLALEEQGAVRRVHGGVTVRPPSLVESSFLYRSHLSDPEKDAIARAALELIESGQAIILDDSTTAGRLAPLLVGIRPLIVITNSLTVIDQLKDAQGIEVICLGGHYNSRFNAFYGYICEQSVASLRANMLFMSSSTVFGDAVYHQQEEVVKTKRAMMAAVERRILMVDSSKFRITALIKLANLNEFDLVITDNYVTADDADMLRQSGAEVRIVRP